MRLHAFTLMHTPWFPAQVNEPTNPAQRLGLTRRIDTFKIRDAGMPHVELERAHLKPVTLLQSAMSKTLRSCRRAGPKCPFAQPARLFELLLEHRVIDDRLFSQLEMIDGLRDHAIRPESSVAPPPDDTLGGP